MHTHSIAARRILVLVAACAAAVVSNAVAQSAPHHRQAREIFERLVAFRSAAGQGQFAPMVRYMTETLRAGGVADADIVTLPYEESMALLVRVRGTDATARPILFSSHMDVVDARPEDWERSPFTLVEEGGMFYGRGTVDNKTGVTSLMSTILRLHADRQQPGRTLVFAFIGDEETEMQTTRLVAAHEWVKNAEYAINSDAGGGDLSADGKALVYLVQGAEKAYADFTLTVKNQGGHSSRPRADNAIYDLARALTRIEQHRFPVMANDLTRSFLGLVGKATPGRQGEMIRRFAANPKDTEAADALFEMPDVVGSTRTTCIATMIDAGHAPNALPQKATANVNCRIFPGHSLEAVHKTLVDVIADSTVTVEAPTDVIVSPVSEARADVMEVITRSIHKAHPGVPVSLYMESGGTDGLVYRSAGIPTWASSGVFMKSSDMFAHGLNERIPVTSFYQAVDHIHDLAVSLGGAAK